MIFFNAVFYDYFFMYDYFVTVFHHLYSAQLNVRFNVKTSFMMSCHNLNIVDIENI